MDGCGEDFLVVEYASGEAALPQNVENWECYLGRHPSFHLRCWSFQYPYSHAVRQLTRFLRVREEVFPKIRAFAADERDKNMPMGFIPHDQEVATDGVGIESVDDLVYERREMPRAEKLDCPMCAAEPVGIKLQTPFRP